MLHYSEEKPSRHLKPFIQCFWKLENKGKANSHYILPDGFFNHLMFLQPNKAPEFQLTGIYTETIKIDIPKQTTIFAIRYKLPAAEHFFGLGLKPFLNAFDTIPPPWNICKYLNPSFEYFIADLSSHFFSFLKTQSMYDGRKMKLFDLIYSNHSYSVQDLSENVTWSSRQINRYFNQQFGLPLKEYLNIIRCKNSYAPISKGIFCAQKGYFDQAHFIHEIKKITGSTPRDLYNHKNDRFLQLSLMYNNY